MDWKNRLTAQKSLSQIYWKARKVASSRWNARVAWFVFLVLVLGLGANFYFGKPIVSYVGLVSGINEISEIGFSLTTSILGFLIAGFAIFASITNRDVFVVLAKLDHTEGGISRLQFMFFNFLLVFIHFIVFLAISIFIKLIHYPGGPLYGRSPIPVCIRTQIPKLHRGLCLFCFGWLASIPPNVAEVVHMELVSSRPRNNRCRSRVGGTARESQRKCVGGNVCYCFRARLVGLEVWFGALIECAS